MLLLGCRVETLSETLNEDPRRPRDSVPSGRRSSLMSLIAAILVAAAAVAVESRTSVVGAPLAVAAGCLLLWIVVLLERKLLEATLGAAFLCLAAMEAMGRPALSSPLKVFPTDPVVVLLIVIGGVHLLAGARLPWLGKHYLVILAAGVWLTAVGVANGNPTFDALGVFRRLCVYPAVYLVGMMAVPLTARATRAMRRVTLVAGLAAAGLALYRMLTGVGYMNEHYLQDNATTRFLSPAESMAPLLALLVVLGYAAAPNARMRPRHVAGMLVFLSTLIGSNFRTIWAATLIALGTWAILAGRRARKTLWPVAALIGLSLAVTVALLWFTNPDALPNEKFSPENLHRGSNWRIGSWSRALEVFLANPIAGTGFGYQHSFAYLTGKSFTEWFAVAQREVHNDLLWLLANGGVTAAVLIIGFHVRWWRGCAAGFGGSPLETPEGRMGVAILATYAGILSVAMFEPIFSMPPAVVAVYLLMAFAGGLADRLRRTGNQATAGSA